jgi:hypothetical protein
MKSDILLNFCSGKN